MRFEGVIGRGRVNKVMNHGANQRRKSGGDFVIFARLYLSNLGALRCQPFNFTFAGLSEQEVRGGVGLDACVKGVNWNPLGRTHDSNQTTNDLGFKVNAACPPISRYYHYVVLVYSMPQEKYQTHAPCF